MARGQAYREKRDQSFVNIALYHFGMNWHGVDIGNHSIDGDGRNGLKVTVLSLRQVCRQTCTNFSIGGSGNHVPYVWHNSGEHSGEGKKAAANRVGTWYLRDGWDSSVARGRADSLKGIDWLKSLSKSWSVSQYN